MGRCLSVLTGGRHRPKGVREMANDLEQQLYVDMADLTEKVPKLKSEIKLLKTRLATLSSRVKSLELMDFQSQISRLDDKINSVSEHSVMVSQSLADFELNFMQYLMSDRIQKCLQGSTCERVKTRIRMTFAQAREAIRHSSEPLKIVRSFTEECERCSKEYKLDVFLG